MAVEVVIYMSREASRWLAKMKINCGGMRHILIQGHRVVTFLYEKARNRPEIIRKYNMYCCIGEGNEAEYSMEILIVDSILPRRRK